MSSALFFSLIAADEGAASWFNYPGAEAWKFINLFLFVIAAIYILRRPLSDALAGRRESIKQELRRAQEERDRAVAALQEIESRLSKLDDEVASIHEHAQAEALAERERLSRETAAELEKLTESTHREIERTTRAAKQELREFAAQQSLQLAQEAIAHDIRPEDDARLIGVGIEQLEDRRN
jgi:F-type H+-transporting ATPase subunit b